MQLTSIIFCIFVILSLVSYWKVNQDNRKYIVLLSNLVFYITYGAQYVVVIILIITISFVAARFIDKCRSKQKLVISILLVLFPLLLFKYCSFFVRLLGIIFKEEELSFKIIAPLGISYYTFQAISYIVDVYNRKTNAEKSFINYSVYMSFFPTVTSGPIQRSGNFLEQLQSVQRFQEDIFVLGIERVIIGYFKKCVIADRILAIINGCILLQRFFANTCNARIYYNAIL